MLYIYINDVTHICLFILLSDYGMEITLFHHSVSIGLYIIDTTVCLILVLHIALKWVDDFMVSTTNMVRGNYQTSGFSLSYTKMNYNELSFNLPIKIF